MSLHQGDNESLKDQVLRLNAALSHYQTAYPNFVLEEYGITKESEAAQAWLAQSKDLPPLLREYDATVFGLQRQLESLESQLARLRSQAQDVAEENERLHQDMRNSVQSRLSVDHAGGGGGDGEVPDAIILQNVQQQLELALQEKEAAQEKWREAAQEVDRLEAELEMEKESHQFRVVEQQAHQVKEQYQQSVAAMNGELDSLQVELRDTRAENGTLTNKVSELKQTVNDLQQQLIWKAQENADTIFKEGFADSKITELKRIMDELRERLADVTRSNDELHRENVTLHTRVTELQRRLSDTELRETEAISQVREAVQMVEAAVLEKDQAEIQAKQRNDELEEMRGVVAKVINKAGERTREEVDAVRKQCNEQVNRLTEELHALEMEGAETKSRLERLMREKRSVESELQQIYKDGMVEGSRAKEAYQQLNTRAIEAERALNEANMKIDSQKMEIDKLTMDYKQLEQKMVTEVKQLQDRLASTQAEFETVNEDRITSMNKVNDLNKKILVAQQEKDAAYRKYAKELALVEQDYHVRTRNWEVKLQTTEDSRSQTVSELRRLLTAQQRMSARWKEECTTLTHKFEGKLAESRAEVAHLKHRNEEITSLLRDSQIKTAEVEKMLSDYTKNIQRMEERVREAELQAGDASKQLMRRSIRERQMVSERDSLLAELARSQGHTSMQPMVTSANALGSSKKGLESSYKREKTLGGTGAPELTLDQLAGSTKLGALSSTTEGR
ncbi:sodium channel and clathrin linker 1 [Plakobranchus ocellatus]|uniref:Sodium channel and clathrin linker 1 n=1 Tax=Plakobranchus ocellatus TaxID=259542 RepID=A0AAV3YLG1_9GAST|nr:sodium channel and clathrin linker 1 [Plakobranchus ocellatus]